MGQKKTKLSLMRTRLLEEAAERLKREGFYGTSLLEYVLGEEESGSFILYSRAFTNDELGFLSIVMDRTVLPYGRVKPCLLYRYQHYKPKLYRSNPDKLAVMAIEDLLSGLGRFLKSEKHLVRYDLETLGIKADFIVGGDGTITGWVESQDGYLSDPSSPNYNLKLPYAFRTSLNQIFHAAEFKRTGVQL